MGVARQCIIDGCIKPGQYQRGMCPMHYRRWRLYGDPSFTTREPDQPGRPCNVPDCDRPYEGLGFCRLHRRRMAKFGTTEVPIRAKSYCSVCGAPAKARGFCDMHYQRWAAHGDPHEDGRRSLAERFFTRLVRAETGCLEWTGATLRGYGQIGDGDRVLYAHRVAFDLAHGPLPDGMFVCHRCDNPCCCEPAHLFAGTAADNVADMIAKGRGHWQRPSGNGDGGDAA